MLSKSMAGIPLKNVRDKEKFRQQYLANLQLENSNNTLNLNASKMYKATGASSQVATPVTTTEKLAGMEGLKQIAKDTLVSARFCNPFVASDAVNMLNAEEIRFLDEYKQFITTDFKGRNVPALVIVRYLRRLMQKLAETEGVEYGIQQAHGEGVILSDPVLYSDKDLKTVSDLLRAMGVNPDAIEYIKKSMEQLNSLMKTREQLEHARGQGPDVYEEVLRGNNHIKETLPDVRELLQLIEGGDLNKLQQALFPSRGIVELSAELEEALSGPEIEGVPEDKDTTGVVGLFGVGESLADTQEDLEELRVQSLRAFVEAPFEMQRVYLETLGVPNVNQMRQIDLYKTYDKYLGALGGLRPAPFASSFAPSAPMPGSASEAPPPSSAAEASAPRPSAPSAPAFAPDLEEETVSGTTVATSLTTASVKSAQSALRASLRGTPDQIIQAISDYERFAEENGASIKGGDSFITQLRKLESSGKPVPATLIGKIADWEATQTAKMEKEAESVGRGMKRHRMRGKGLARTKPKRKPVERAESYEKPKPYRQFGRYLIHHHKLKDGILMIKYPSGNRVQQIPSAKISPELTTVLREMAEGRTPQYKHFEGMSVEDKEKFHHIVRHSQFETVEVPHPNRDALDKEVERFEILRGEILAGNDNKEMIREFKAKLLKFSREGRIPRREANEIMEHLLMMGV